MTEAHRSAEKRSCLFRHDWTKWMDFWKGAEVPRWVKDPKEGDGTPLLIQERRCQRCNAAERRTVRPNHV